MSLLDQLGAKAKASLTRPPADDGNRYHDPPYQPDRISTEALDDTPGESTDLGPIVDEANWRDAGGLPQPERFPGDDRDIYERQFIKRARPEVRAWNSIRMAFTAAQPDLRSVLVTPSGVDAEYVKRITIVASVANAVKVGPSDNEAAGGAFLPAGQPVVIETGPLWIAPPAPAIAVNIDVFFEYVIPPHPGPHTDDCGCGGGK